MKRVVYSDLTTKEQEILQKAKEASGHYFNPNGTHYVGAALCTSDGLYFQGSAVRRQSASSNTCSERMAIDQAIYAGKHDYTTLALVGFNKDGSIAEPMFPCGACRQIIFEFYQQAKPESILVSNSDMSEIIKTDIHELLPSVYKSHNLRIR